MVKKALAGNLGALGDHFHTTVVEVRGGSAEPEFERARTRPPAETHSLDASSHPGGHPHG